MSHHTFLPSMMSTPVEVPSRQTAERAALGATLLRREGSHRLGKRWLARSHEGGAPLLAYELSPSVTTAPHEAQLARVVAHRHTHAVGIERLIHVGQEPRWVLCAYPGTHEGVLSLDQLLQRKPEGRMSTFEASRAMRQMLHLVADSRDAMLAHGPLRIDEILVDRHGRLLVELFGLAGALGVRRLDATTEVSRAEVRAIFEIGRELVTGAAGGDLRLGPPRNLWPDAPRPWRDWLAQGLSESGFTSARQALASMPS